MNVLILSPYSDSVTHIFESANDTYITCEEPIDVDYCLAHNVDFIVSFGYRYIIQPSVLAIFPLKAINIHMSYLLFCRGSHPNFWSIVDQLPSGVTIHMIDASLDTGNILFQKQVSFDHSYHTFATSYSLLFSECINLLELNWKYIRLSLFDGWPQIGESSYHRSSDIDQYASCLPDTWNTPISSFLKMKTSNSSS